MRRKQSQAACWSKGVVLFCVHKAQCCAVLRICTVCHFSKAFCYVLLLLLHYRLASVFVQAAVWPGASVKPVVSCAASGAALGPVHALSQNLTEQTCLQSISCWRREHWEGLALQCWGSTLAGACEQPLLHSVDTAQPAEATAAVAQSAGVLQPCSGVAFLIY
jgi:hypothetical protein